MEPVTETPGAGVDPAGPGLVEVGWVVSGTLPEATLQAVRAAAGQVCDELAARFPEFQWRMPMVVRPEPEFADGKRAEPATLLQQADWEREAGHWDFAFVLTPRDLRTYYKDFAYAAPSRALDCAVVSLARLEPELGPQADGTALAQRLKALVLHLFGHLNNLTDTDDPADYMFGLCDARELDRMAGYAAPDREALREALARVADARVEEQSPPPAPLFYLRAVWANRQDLREAVLRAKPWQFPLRFSRLTTAALSTLLVLGMTAEAWELGMTRAPGLVVLLSVLALAGTSLFILVRQNLLLRGRRRTLSEQRVTGTVAAAVVTLCGMLTVYVLLFATTLGFGLVLVSDEIVRTWAASLTGPVAFRHYLTMAGLAATFGTIIGALGASFEGGAYFRHVTFIDEET